MFSCWPKGLKVHLRKVPSFKELSFATATTTKLRIPWETSLLGEKSLPFYYEAIWKLSNQAFKK